MAYYLTIKEKNNYKELNITTLSEFKRISKFKNSSYSLEEIDITIIRKFNAIIRKISKSTVWFSI